MRPRIAVAQKVSQAEIIMCDGVSRPRRIKTTHIYTYVFERKVYLKRNETSIYIECGFKIYYE